MDIKTAAQTIRDTVSMDEVLSLYGNKITDVTPLANLTKLERLWLSDNQITDISALDNLTNLRMLKINGNPVNE